MNQIQFQVLIQEVTQKVAQIMTSHMISEFQQDKSTQFPDVEETNKFHQQSKDQKYYDELVKNIIDPQLPEQDEQFKNSNFSEAQQPEVKQLSLNLQQVNSNSNIQRLSSEENEKQSLQQENQFSVKNSSKEEKYKQLTLLEDISEIEEMTSEKYQMKLLCLAQQKMQQTLEMLASKFIIQDSNGEIVQKTTKKRRNSSQCQLEDQNEDDVQILEVKGKVLSKKNTKSLKFKSQNALPPKEKQQLQYYAEKSKMIKISVFGVIQGDHIKCKLCSCKYQRLQHLSGHWKKKHPVEYENLKNPKDQ